MFAVAGTGSLKLESGPPGRCRSLGPGWRSRQQRRWQRRDGEMKTVSEGGGRADGEWQESGKGGELKGTEAREGESFRSRPPNTHSFSLCTWTTSFLLSPWHSSPQFRLPWSCHGNREARPGEAGGTKRMKEGKENSLESLSQRLAVVITLWEASSMDSPTHLQTPFTRTWLTQGVLFSVPLRTPAR